MPKSTITQETILKLPVENIFTFYEGNDKNKYDQLSGRNLNLAPLELQLNIKELYRVMQIILTGGNPEGYIYEQSTIYTDNSVLNVKNELKNYYTTEINQFNEVIRKFISESEKKTINDYNVIVDKKLNDKSNSDRAYADGGDTETLAAAEKFAKDSDMDVINQCEIYANNGDKATYLNAKKYIDMKTAPKPTTKSCIDTVEICSRSSFSNSMVRTVLDEMWVFGGTVKNNPKGDGTYDAQNSFRLAFPGETGKYVKSDMSGAESFVLFDSGNLWAWGHNKTGACGAGHNDPIMVPELVETDVVTFYRPISPGIHINYSSTWIIKKDGLAYASGFNEYGNMGIGDILEVGTRHVNVFTVVSFFVENTIEKIWPIGNRYASTIVLLKGGQIYAAGYNHNGNLGTGDKIDRYQFELVTAAWGGHVNNDEEIEFYGVNGYSSNGYLDGSYEYKDDPTDFDNTVYDYNSQSFLLCYRKLKNKDAMYLTCGNNNWGQIGSGYIYDKNNNIIDIHTQDIDIVKPFLIQSVLPKEAKEISVFGGGPASIFVLGVDGDLYAWGYNKSYQLGLNLPHNVYEPTLVNTNKKITKLFMNGYDSYTESYRNAMFIKDENNNLYSCGFNDFGLLGIGSNKPVNRFTRVHLSDDVNIIDLKCSGADHGKFVVALDSEHKVWVWGFNGRNDLFLNNTSSVLVPKQKAIQSAP